MTPARICDIKFISGKRASNNSDDTDAISSQKKTCVTQQIPVPLESELYAFYDAINQAKKKPAILKVTPPYSEDFVPVLSQSVYPLAIMELYKPEALALKYHDLLTECEQTVDTIKVSQLV